MAEDRIALLEMLRKATADGDADFLREGVRVLAEAVMEAEVSELTGLPKGERDPERRLTHRNGYRARRWDTRVGTIDLAVPRVRDGSYLPSPLDPRRRTERALLAVVQEAYVAGVSTRRVDDLVRALGIEGISRSEVSRNNLGQSLASYRRSVLRGHSGNHHQGSPGPRVTASSDRRSSSGRRMLPKAHPVPRRHMTARAVEPRVSRVWTAGPNDRAAGPFRVARVGATENGPQRPS